MTKPVNSVTQQLAEKVGLDLNAQHAEGVRQLAELGGVVLESLLMVSTVERDGRFYAMQKLSYEDEDAEPVPLRVKPAVKGFATRAQCDEFVLRFYLQAAALSVYRRTHMVSLEEAPTTDPLDTN